MTVLSPKELEKMRIANRMAADTLEMITPFVKAGVTTEELNTRCHDYIVNHHGAKPAALHYHGFPKSICTSVNHVICHGIPGDKKLKSGDIINIDLVVQKDGFHGDTSKMFIVGKPSILAKRLVEVTQECLYLGIQAVKPGNTLRDIGVAIENHAHAHHFSVVEDYCGHGISRSMHESPEVLHYAAKDKLGKARQSIEIKPGMIFTIEPMINAGKKETKLMPDHWTVITQDRKLSAQWEHTLLVTESGCDVLSFREEEREKLSHYITLPA